MIKLDIINEVVGKTGITKTKAELAVETVFESMKKALAAGYQMHIAKPISSAQLVATIAQLVGKNN